MNLELFDLSLNEDLYNKFLELVPHETPKLNQTQQKKMDEYNDISKLDVPEHKRKEITIQFMANNPTIFVIRKQRSHVKFHNNTMLLYLNKYHLCTTDPLMQNKIYLKIREFEVSFLGSETYSGMFNTLFEQFIKRTGLNGYQN